MPQRAGITFGAILLCTSCALLLIAFLMPIESEVLQRIGWWAMWIGGVSALAGLAGSLARAELADSKERIGISILIVDVLRALGSAGQPETRGYLWTLIGGAILAGIGVLLHFN